MAETFLYLTTTGRKSGNPHQIEIWFVEHEGCYYLCSERRTAADWVKNILNNPDVIFYVGHRDQPVPSAQTGTARTLEETDPLNDHIKTLFDQKYNWSSGLMVEICAR